MQSNLLILVIVCLYFFEASAIPTFVLRKQSTCSATSMKTILQLCVGGAISDDDNKSNDDSYNQNTAEESTTVITKDRSDDGEPKEEEIQENSSAMDNNDGSEDTTPGWRFPLLQKGDGHENDPDGLPGRYLRMQKDDRIKAKEALECTMEWRKEHQIDTILTRPHTKLDICKRILPHAFAGRDNTDHIIFYQRPGLIDIPKAKENDLSMEDLLFHYVYVLEYCWNIEESRPDQTMTSIIDLTGVKLSLLQSKELLGFVKQFVSMMSEHYPQRSYKTFLVNAPRWFGALFKLISPLLRASTKAKIQICSKAKEQRDLLKTYLGEDIVNNLLPQTLVDGKSLTNNDDIQSSDMETRLRDFCLARLEEAGMTMQTFV